MTDRPNLPHALRALKHRNFRIYFVAQAISIFGSWIQQVAMTWLVYRLSGSAMLLGATAFAALIPQLLVGPFAGAWSDRHDKRRMLIIVESLLLGQALLLAVLTWGGWIRPFMVIPLAGLLGVLNAFETPLRQSLISRMVPVNEDLPNALALNAMLFNSGRFLAPPLAGFLLAVSSEGTCFALNAISFLALIAGIRKFDFAPAARSKASLGDVFREGLRYAMQTHSVRTLLITLVITNLTASSYAVLLPLFAKEILGGDSVTLGWLWGAAGCGAFLSTIFLASHRSSGGIAIVIASGTLLCAGALFGLAFSGQFVTSILTMVVLGFGISVTNVGCNIVLQAMAPDTMRGRVISFFTSVRFGFDALGGLIAGAIAAQLGVPPTLLVEAVIQLCGAFWLASHLRALRSGIVNPPPLTVARGS